MKNAKIILTGIAILAVIGGAFAYKAAFPKTFFVADNNGKCLAETQFVYSIVPITYTAIPTFTYALSVAAINLPCPITKVINFQ